MKKFIKKIIRNLGYEVHRYIPGSSSSAQIISSFRKFDIDLVLDIGANTGQFGSELRGGGYQGEIISYEPLSSAHAELVRNSSNDSAWQVYPRCALGDHIGEAIINIAANSASSSLLPMLGSHLDAAPYTKYVGSEAAPLLTLDSVALDKVVRFKNPFIKIDTQGFEWRVLDGSVQVLSYARGLLLELSLVRLYDDQHLWRKVIERLEQSGFNLWAIQPEFISPNDGRTLQVNGIFFRGEF